MVRLEVVLGVFLCGDVRITGFSPKRLKLPIRIFRCDEPLE